MNLLNSIQKKLKKQKIKSIREPKPPNICVEAENGRRSRVLQSQDPRPSALSAHDSRSTGKKDK